MTIVWSRNHNFFAKFENRAILFRFQNFEFKKNKTNEQQHITGYTVYIVI